jgi:hypothetical protein
VNDQVGQHGFLERRLEGLDQLVRELADEADRVGEQVAAAVLREGAGCRVEGLEQPLPHADPRSGHGVQQGRLARVRVAGERNGGQGGALPPGSHHGPVSPHTLQPAAQSRDSVSGEAAVGLDLGLAGAPRADPAVDPPGAQALEVRPQAAHPGEVVLELSQLDLELALGRVGVVGEDVEDHRRAVDHRDAESLLEIALLPRRELVIGRDHVGVRRLDLALQLRQLALAEIEVGIGLRAPLDQLAGGGHARGAQQLLQLRERVLGMVRVANDAHDQRTLGRARIGDAGAIAAMRLSVAGSIHRPDVRARTGAVPRAAWSG